MDYEDLNNWADLANAVVLQASQDYREVSLMLKYRPNQRRLLKQKETLECFFLSGWFKKLSGLDGEALLKSIQKEMSV